MRKTPLFSFLTFCMAPLFALSLSAATFTGVVTNKTNNKPSPGDTVTLVDVQAGMADVGSATTDASGHYSITGPGMGPYLIRVSHQGAGYFIAAPQGGSSGDVSVYDVAAKVDGVGIDADMLLVESGGGVLRVQERFLVRNTSLPPRAQFSEKTFEIAIPADAELDGASATRPGGLGTTTRIIPLKEKGHYTFNTPIQPNKGEKETMFEVQYHLPFSGSYTFTHTPLMHADHLVVYLAPGIHFSHASGADFQATQEDPRVQTYVARNVGPGQKISFMVSGEGQMARDSQGSGMGQSSGMSTGVAGGPGGGIGAPINTPDPLTRYKWWILSALGLLLIGGVAFFLRRQGTLLPAAGHSVTELRPEVTADLHGSGEHRPISTFQASSGAGKDLLLNRIKEEMFAIESERLTGTLAQKDYTEIKNGLDALLKRLLK